MADEIGKVSCRGLSVLGRREHGDRVVDRIAMAPGRESEAARDVLALLREGAEVSLMNDLDEEGEGQSTFRRSATGLEAKRGGHGWQGEWRPIDEPALLSELARLAPFNRGGHGSTEGSVARKK